jgi:hypothetical protein
VKMAHEVIRNDVATFASTSRSSRYRSADLTVGAHVLVTTPVGRLVGLLALAEKR